MYKKNRIGTGKPYEIIVLTLTSFINIRIYCPSQLFMVAQSK